MPMGSSPYSKPPPTPKNIDNGIVFRGNKPRPIGGGLKLVKGSAEAKAWGEKMRALRKK